MKKVYETPFTTHVRVEMESQLCAGSATVKNPDNANGRIDAHDEVTNPNEPTAGINEHSTNTSFGGDFSTSWDPEPTSSN